MICRAMGALIDPLRKVHLGDIRAWHNRIPMYKQTVDHFVYSIVKLRYLRSRDRSEGSWLHGGDVVAIVTQ